MLCSSASSSVAAVDAQRSDLLRPVRNERQTLEFISKVVSSRLVVSVQSRLQSRLVVEDKEATESC